MSAKATLTSERTPGAAEVEARRLMVVPVDDRDGCNRRGRTILGGGRGRLNGG